MQRRKMLKVIGLAIVGFFVLGTVFNIVRFREGARLGNYKKIQEIVTTIEDREESIPTKREAKKLLKLGKNYFRSKQGRIKAYDLGMMDYNVLQVAKRMIYYYPELQGQYNDLDGWREHDLKRE